MSSVLVVDPEGQLVSLASSLAAYGAATATVRGVDEAREELGRARFDAVVADGEHIPAPAFLEVCRRSGRPSVIWVADRPFADPSYGPVLAWSLAAPPELLPATLSSLVRRTRLEGVLEGLSSLAGEVSDARRAVSWVSRLLAQWAALYIFLDGPTARLLVRSDGAPELPEAIEPGQGELGRRLAEGTLGWVQGQLVVPLIRDSKVRGLLLLQPSPGLEGAIEGLSVLAADIIATRMPGIGEGARPAVELSKTIAQEKLSSLSQLCAGISHEINNPLFVVMGGLELVAQHVHDDMRPLIQHSLKATERIRRIVADMRRFYMPTRRMDAEGPIDLNEILESAIQIVSLQDVLARVTFVTRLAHDLGHVVADDTQLLQVFLNLFLNAAQAMPAGGSITVSTHNQGDLVEVRIADEGIGIAPENLARIFDPFFTTKQDWTGTGLGLSVTYAILRHYGGSIDVESHLGRGSVFTLRLPQKPGTTAAAPAPARG